MSCQFVKHFLTDLQILIYCSLIPYQMNRAVWKPRFQWAFVQMSAFDCCKTLILKTPFMSHLPLWVCFVNSWDCVQREMCWWGMKMFRKITMTQLSHWHSLFERPRKKLFRSVCERTDNIVKSLCTQNEAIDGYTYIHITWVLNVQTKGTHQPGFSSSVSPIKLMHMAVQSYIHTTVLFKNCETFMFMPWNYTTLALLNLQKCKKVWSAMDQFYFIITAIAKTMNTRKQSLIVFWMCATWKKWSRGLFNFHIRQECPNSSPHGSLSYMS